MILELQHLRKEGPPRIFPITELPAVVGRGDTATVCVRHKSISREHVRIFEREGRLHIADLNSSNGTFVNDRRVTLSAVEPGDEIRLGTMVLRLSAPEEEGVEGPVSDPEKEAAGMTPAPTRSPAPAEAPEPEPPLDASQDTVDEFLLPGSEEEATEEDPGGSRAGPPPSAPRSPRTTGARPVDSRGSVAAPAREPDLSAGPGEIRVRQQILQFNRKDPKKGRSFLKDDFSQYGGLSRLLLVVLFIVLAGGGFLFFRWLGEEVTPSGVDSGGLEAGEERGYGEGNPEDL